MFYKNISCSVKTFYGVEFKPGEIKEVPGYVNSTYMIVVDKPVEELITRQSKPSSDKTKKTSEKAEVIPEANSEEKSQSKDNDNEAQSSKA